MKTAKVTWVGERQFLAMTPSGHAVPLDCDRARNSAPGPMELLPVALACCTAVDIVAILEKKRQKLEALEVEVLAGQAPEPPTVWTGFEIVYRLRGRLEKKSVEDAIALSQDKYCSVSAMLRKAAPISLRYEILPAESPAGAA
jgi:putative redox protein